MLFDFDYSGAYSRYQERVEGSPINVELAIVLNPSLQDFFRETLRGCALMRWTLSCGCDLG